MNKEQLTLEDLRIIAALCRVVRDMPILTDIDLDGIADRALNTISDMQEDSKQILYVSTVTGETCKVDYL